MFYILLILPLLHKLWNFSPGLYPLDCLCSMPKHQTQTEKVKQIIWKPSILFLFLQVEASLPPFQQM